MSDSVTNVEVEDVLSSIRRLVSDDKRPSMVVNPAPSNDRLVLTPALRVADSSAVSVRKVEDELTIQAWSDFGASPDLSKDPVPDHSGAQAELDAIDALHVQDDGDVRHGDDGAEHDHIFGSPDEKDDGQNDLQEQPASLDVYAEPFVLEFPAESKIEDGGHNYADDLQIMEGHKADAQDFEIPNAEAEGVKIDLTEVVEDQSEGWFFASSAASLSAKIVALETVIGKTDDQWEPDDTGDSDYSGTEAPAMTWVEADVAITAEDAAIQADGTENPEPETEPESGFAQPVDDLLDEDALRDFVSEIVREELQGALGERITRNVRKLVRREIHRALAAHELE